VLPLNFNHLYYFYVVAKARSFSEAARELNVSQSSISVQIRLFEEYLGHKLFNRLKKGVELTESGVVFSSSPKRCFTMSIGYGTILRRWSGKSRERSRSARSTASASIRFPVCSSSLPVSTPRSR